MSNSNKPAFPCRAPVEFKTMPNGLMCQEETVHEGLTIRDYFAAKAMQALLAKSPFIPPGTVTLGKAREIQHGIAMGAWDMADAMLKARDQ